ncbi:MAG TPA: hypothetical protein DCY20_00045, partial [Firmicutes bacterium]|nr:hypothetical protein [Bacillota bacterium]
KILKGGFYGIFTASILTLSFMQTVSASSLLSENGGSFIIGSDSNPLEKIGFGSCSGVKTVETDNYTNYQAEWKRGCENNKLVSVYYFYWSDLINMGRASSTNGEGAYRTSPWVLNTQFSDRASASAPTNTWTKAGTNYVNYDYLKK